MRTGLLRFIGVLLGSGLLLVVLAWSSARYNESQAEQLIQIIGKEQLGKAQESGLSDQLGHFLRYRADSDLCASGGVRTCDTYVFENRVPSFLHLSPKESIDVSLSYRGGVLVERHLLIEGDPRWGGSVIQGVKPFGFTALLRASEDRQVSGNNLEGGSSIVKVVDASSLPREQLERDWTFDLSCFGTLAGCRFPRRALVGAFPK